VQEHRETEGWPVTDPELTYRAEQAYLGALIARQGRPGTGTAVAGDAGPGGFVGLHPRDFADPVHQAVYAALAAQATPGPRGLAGLYDRFRGLLYRLLHARARDAGTYLAELPGMCPDPANLAAYAAMVAEASQLRAGPAPVPEPPRPPAPEPRQPPVPGPSRAAMGNPRLASAGEWLESTGPRHRRPRRAQAAPPAATVPAATVPVSRTGQAADDELAPDVARLARALRAGARSATRGAQETALTAVPPQGQPAPLDAEALQEEILADLMRRPADGRGIVAWLPDTVFSAGPNRSLYQLISLRLAHGRPVDPLIIAWDASLLSDPRSIAATPGTTTRIESLAAAALRIGALDPAPGASAVLSRALYADQVCTDTFGPDWPQEPALAPVPPAPADPPRAPEPGPPAATQAVATITDQPGPVPAPAPSFSPSPSPAPAPASSPSPAAGTGRQTGTARTARHPMPALPRRAPSLPLRPPPAPEPASPGPAPRM
jgi:hypothetical protein